MPFKICFCILRIRKMPYQWNTFLWTFSKVNKNIWSILYIFSRKGFLERDFWPGSGIVLHRGCKIIFSWSTIKIMFLFYWCLLVFRFRSSLLLKIWQIQYIFKFITVFCTARYSIFWNWSLVSYIKKA